MHNMESILYKLQYWADMTPEKVCLVDARTGETCTYRELWDGIRRYAATVDSGKYLILKTSQTIAHMVAFYGIQAAGSVAIPIEANASETRIAELEEQFHAELIERDRELPEVYGNVVLPDEESIACIICTTGTTGKSKGVMSSFRCRFCGADNVRYSYGITQDDVALVPQVLSHSGGLRRVEAMLVSGAQAVIMGAAMMFGNVFSAIKTYRCNILQFVPAQVTQILDRAQKLLLQVEPQIRIVSVGSAVITEHDKERLRELLPNARLFNDFGSTEAIGAAYFEWSAYEPKPGCVGIESLHSRIVFLDDSGEIIENTSMQNPGIIATEGRTLMSGYLNDPKQTAAVMQNDRVISADLGYRGEDGMIYILGRRDDVIVCGANKISPTEIEDAALTVTGVKECACVPKQDEVMGQMPALFVVLGKNAPTISELLCVLKNKLDKFKVPREENIFVIDALPRTEGTGKILKKELQRRL